MQATEPDKEVALKTQNTPQGETARTSPIVEFLATLPQFALFPRDRCAIHLNTGCLVDTVTDRRRDDAHLFTLRLRWPDVTGHAEHLVEANKYVEFQILEAHQFGGNISGLRKMAELAFIEAADVWVRANSVDAGVHE